MKQGRPLIAISGRCETASWGMWRDLETAFVSSSYVRAVQAAGADVVIVPPGGGAKQVRRADGLILAGGADVDPSYYGASRHPQTQAAPKEQDELEFGLLAEALGAGMPVLGICRGMQVLTAASGGTLIQHLPDVVAAKKHLGSNNGFGEHEVALTPGSKLFDIYQAERIMVRTMHHQAVDDPGVLTVCARAEDGIIEAVEDADRPFVLGVQWHAEAGNEQPLFRQLVAHAAERL